MSSEKCIHIVGGGLAGSEAAWQIASQNIPVRIHEMRPIKQTAAHKSEQLAELVCSNSFRSDDMIYNAVGLLHEEMRRNNSLILRAADNNKVPAGSALAVDRECFSNEVSRVLSDHPLITIIRQEISVLPPDSWENVIVATGPLTSPKLASALQSITKETPLAFFDAIAPIIYKDSINFKNAWFQSRYDKGTGSDYINCGMSSTEYDNFVQELCNAEIKQFKSWETDTPYFEGCLPIEVIASRGHSTLAFGPMKPIGLTNPQDPSRKYKAIVQLRQDNKLGTLYNMVGFQTKLSYSEQKRIFRLIPGLENAEFARLGGVHRNTFLNSPKLLDSTLKLKSAPNLRFAGQITGCEGYVESAAIGLMAGKFACSDYRREPYSMPPPTTALGAILDHITKGAFKETFQPMNINFGLFPPLKIDSPSGKYQVRGRERKRAMSERALLDLKDWYIQR